MLDHDKEDAVTAPNLPNPTPVAPPQQQGTATPVPQLDAAAHGRASFMFSINGRQTNDFAAVQAHITALEGENGTLRAVQAEAKTANRKDFIKGLAEGSTPRILASQIPDIEAYALGMDDTAWAAFQKAHEAMPVLSTVAQHANATSNGAQVNPNGQAPVGGAAPGDTDLETAVAIFEHHKLGGMKPEKLKATPSYSKIKNATTTDPALQARITAALASVPA